MAIIIYERSRDLDFEFPSTSAQGAGFADLFTELRTSFKALKQKNGETIPYQLTVSAMLYSPRYPTYLKLQAAVPGGDANYKYFVIPQMDAALTFWNVMAYDFVALTVDRFLSHFHRYEFAGSWSSVVSSMSISVQDVSDGNTDR
jgi:GH18 family chitinase